MRASLEGMAKQIIQSLEFSSSNYEVAWDILCSRFHYKTLLVQNHIKGIFEIHPLGGESSEGLIIGEFGSTDEGLGCVIDIPSYDKVW